MSPGAVAQPTPAAASEDVKTKQEHEKQHIHSDERGLKALSHGGIPIPGTLQLTPSSPYPSPPSSLQPIYLHLQH
ncbi:uncharacterized protein ARB_07833 [Trichophyton benhamiae CBS 112371]|uniref:Uncharacterized protein n=1 Tax=Arthroderma benhamiae (strain ATCC MYA-4681 / CBS 112371) TaxID=663331 RepID=D4AU20_ARTBC|nr:uncharacterized protein ARB_07833 [Trichophyton benhamiae CBS 112371]EFE33473.1 hypothetical protein ARB_07833 [Trichophyton benhamiae CBS 112371]